MRLAVAAGGPAAENNAYVLALLGELERRRGRAAAARRAFGRRSRWCRDFAGRRGGPGAARSAATTAAAPSRLRGVVERLPLPEYVIALGEAELAAGDTAARARTSRWSRAEQQLQRAAGVDMDVELAVFEADHGDPAHGGRARPRAAGRRRRACAPPTRSAGR